MSFKIDWNFINMLICSYQIDDNYKNNVPNRMIVQWIETITTTKIIILKETIESVKWLHQQTDKICIHIGKKKEKKMTALKYPIEK